MCGIVGYLSRDDLSKDSCINSLHRMVSSINHRGPDDRGIWTNHDQHKLLGLGHCRLSILDTSAAGHQPMMSSSKRYVITFNGEIYNHLEIRSLINKIQNIPLSIASSSWKGYSDTETLLAAFETWGVVETFQKIVGMFALAVWDLEKQSLYLARDRMGEKPLYYGGDSKNFFFGSELKALKANPYFKKEIDRDKLALFLRYNYIPTPYSIYKGVFKLPPGSYVEVNYKSNFSDIKIKKFWSLQKIAEDGQSSLLAISDFEAANLLEEKLKTSVSEQMIADVPVGSFLSGGVDSSLIVSLMQSLRSAPIKTFTVGFDNDFYNEAKFAKKIASYLGTDHSEVYISSVDLLKIVPNLYKIYDEPFADSSQIPTFLISQIACQTVKVALAGDGGDEIFGGYNRYTIAMKLFNKYEWIPFEIKLNLIRLLNLIPNKLFNSFMNLIFHIDDDKVRKIFDIILAPNQQIMYTNLISQWKNPDEVVLNSSEPITLPFSEKSWPKFNSFENTMMTLDSLTYLMDDILVKTDRAAMAVSLETREPYLDYRVVEFAWKLPLDQKIRDGTSKWILRQILAKYLPLKLIDRQKKGFSVPIADWLRGPLKKWAEELLNESRLQREGYFNAKLIREVWSNHISGRRNEQHRLWNILMFQSWLENESI